MWRILFLPGFLFLWISYYMPIEWGKQRNIGRFRRQYKEAPVIWSAFYTVCFFIMLAPIYLPFFLAS